MAFTAAWRNFKRMQDLTVAAASLIYAAAAIDAVERLPAGSATAVSWMVLWPLVFLAVSLVAPLAIAPIRRTLSRYVWMSFKAGFGQTPGSIVTGVAVLLAAGSFIYYVVGQDAQHGRLGANVFAAYAAGIGILAAQAVLARALERIPDVRREIEAKD